MWKEFAHFHQRRCSDSIFRRHRFIIKKMFARNIGKIEGKVIGGVDDHYIFERSERKDTQCHLANRSAKGRQKVVGDVVAISPATTNPIMPSNASKLL